MNALTPWTPEPGVYDGLAASTYHASAGISKSKLDLIHMEPALLEWAANAPRDEDCKAAVDTGTAFHTLLLEPERFGDLYAVEFTPPDGAISSVAELKAALTEREIKAPSGADKATLTKLLLDADPDAPVTDVLAQEWARGINGRAVLTIAEHRKLILMRDSVMAHPTARKLVEAEGHVERSYYWQDAETGELCRSRADKAIPPLNLLLDVKTTADVGKFERSVADYRYHVQDPYYTDGHEAATGEALRGFLFLVISTTRDRARYPVRMFSLDQTARDIGRAEYRADLHRYAQCQRDASWPGIGSLSLPHWRLAQAAVTA